jgi:hypothetical protein
MNGVTGENTARRYPMSFAIRYVMGAPGAGQTWVGETLWMSSGEVAFLSKGPAGVGDKVAMHIEWPVLLEGETPLQLTATVEIVQRSGPLSIAKLSRYEFRTRRLQPSSMGARHPLPIPAWQMPTVRQMPAMKAFGSGLPQPAVAASAAGG